MSDDDAPVQRAVSQGDLFGSDSDSDSGAEQEYRDDGAVKAGAWVPEQADEDQGPLRVGLAAQPRPRAGAKPFTARLPSFLVCQPAPFEPDSFEEDEEISSFKNVVRWRFVRDEDGNVLREEDGRPKRESNARFARWSDGSLSLQVGGEVFEVVTQPTNNQFLYGLRKAQGASNLEAVTELPEKFVFRPTSLTSSTHQALTLGVRSRHVKEARVMSTAATDDPEKAAQARSKMREDKLKARDAKRARADHAEGSRRAPKRSGAYLEEGAGSESDSDSDSNMGAIKAKAGKGKKKLSKAEFKRVQEAQWAKDEESSARSGAGSGSDSESDPGSPAAAPAPARSAAVAVAAAAVAVAEAEPMEVESEPEDEAAFEEEEEEEEAAGPVSKRARKVIADSDSD